MRKVLIVDDIEINRELLKKILSSEYDILEACNGQEALAAMHTGYKILSAVVLDLMMPVMDGYEVLRQMRDNAALSQIPVIVVTGNVEEEARVKALSLGANDFVVKPYNPDIIRHCLRNNIKLRETASIINAIQRDKLTGIYCREAFFEKVREALKTEKNDAYVMACFDIDNFKLVNDRYGAEEGDRILKYIGAEVQKAFHHVGGICGRISGDNFAGIFPNTAEAEKYISECRTKKFIPADASINMTFSVGRYIISDSRLSVSAMYDRAYIAKQSVKGMYDRHVAYFDESMLDRLVQEQQIISEMSEALDKNEFEVWFQPQMNHATGALIGAEALVRWRSPKRGLISPGIFIPVFEQNGFIYELDKYVWERTCAYLRKWTDEGRNPMPVSVNISRYDIFREDLVDVINGLVKKYGLSTDQLRLEITESAFAKSTEKIIEVVKRLMECGFVIEIDDFGSGYSSLNTLKNVPANVLKLDMKFLEDAGNAQRGGNIVESIVRMAKWLGMSVLAEGVEEIEQADFLKSIGCSYIQGYLYAKPMPPAEYEAYAQNIGKEEKMLALETVENMDNNAFWNPKSMDTLIFNSFVGGACIFEYCDGNIELLRSTDKFAKILGSSKMTVEDVLRLDWISLLAPESLQKVRSVLKRSIVTREEITDEYVFIDLPGCPRETYLRATMRVIAAAGTRYLVYCTSENITAQREAEQTAKETGERLSAIMANINGGVTAAIIRDDEVQFLFTNDQYYTQLGYTREQYESEVHDGPFSLVHPEDRRTVMERTNEAAREKKSFCIDYRIIRRDGGVRWILSNISIMHFPSVEEPVQLAVANDITEQRMAEEKEQKTATQMQAIMDNVDSGITAVAIGKGDNQILFANGKYYELFGTTRDQAQIGTKDNYSFVHPEDREMVRASVREVSDVGKTATVEYRAVHPDGKIVWIRTALSMARFAGIKAPVQLAIFSDITAEKAAEQHLRQTDEQLRFLNDISHNLLAQPDSDKGIGDVLEKLRSYFNGNHAYIFEFDYENSLLSNTYEVCAEGLLGKHDKMQKLPLRVAEYWLHAFDHNTHVEIEKVQKLDDARPEKAALMAQGIESLLAVPLKRDGKLIGFIAVDDPDHHRVKAEDLTALGDYIAVMLTRRDLNEKILSDSANIKTLMDDTPGGFCRLQMLPDRKGVVPVYFNDGFCKITGMNPEEVKAAFTGKGPSSVHPDDIGAVKELSRDFSSGNGQFSTRCRLRHGDKDYIWVLISGRFVTAETGEVFLNSYYSDITEQVRKEDQQKELLDNLPYGAALYEYDGKKLHAIHLNRSYWQMMGRKTQDLLEASSLEPVHPDDRLIVAEELHAAIAEKRDAACDIRILYGAKDYRSFHAVGRIVKKTDGKYAIYVVFTRISSSEMTFRETIPFLLSTIMESSTDLSFAKDRNFRYLCCSNAFAAMLGYAGEQDIIGKTDYDILPKEHADEIRQLDIRMMADGEPVIDRVELLPSQDGVPHYANMSKYLLRDTCGEVIGVYGNGRDITENRETYVQLKLLTNSIPGGIATYLCTPAGIKITYFNDGFCRLFRCTREEYLTLSDGDPMTGIYEEDLPMLRRQIDEGLRGDAAIDCVYRVRLRDKSYKWINLKAVVSDRNGDTATLNAVLLDVTEEQESTERLRMSEEEYRLAMQLSGNIIGRYSVAEHTVTLAPEVASAFAFPEQIGDVPHGVVRSGAISSESVKVYTDFYAEIDSGSRSGSAVFQRQTVSGWVWLEAKYSTIFSDSGKPVSAVISYANVTDRLQKECIYKKWQQSLHDRPEDSYTLFCCNLNKDTTFDSMEGNLIRIDLDESEITFDERTAEYVKQSVSEKDAKRYLSVVKADTLLANYYRGKRSDTLEFRENLPEGGVRWLRLSIDLVEYPNSTEVEAYLMFENIDEDKKAELLAIERAEKDILTGALNRAAFETQVDDIIRCSQPGAQYALLMLDIDGFKLVNDAFGHDTGDQALADIAQRIRSVLREEDLLGRLGGDEFVVFLNEIANDSVAANVAQEICVLTRKSFSAEVQISASIGIAVCRRDGKNFAALYKKADMALYHVKGSGKDDYVFYREDIKNENMEPEVGADAAPRLQPNGMKRRMLIVDDSPVDVRIMSHIFKDDFVVDSTPDGNTALIRLHHYGSAISVVLLDLFMPSLDGFAILKKMRESSEMQTIPVIVVSGDDQSETSLRAIRSGASDFVTKPFDPELLRIRVLSAISKSENDHLRVQNNYLMLKNDEVERYRTVLKHAGIAVIENDWVRGTFSYDPEVSAHLAGIYDGRKLWRIFLSDMVADTTTVQKMQRLLQNMAADRDCMEKTITLQLKTPSRVKHWFNLTVYKKVNEFRLTTKFILAFSDLGAEQPQKEE